MPRGIPNKRPLDYRCKDADRDLIVAIKPTDIKGATPNVNNACAAANALCRQEGFKEARVYRGVTYVQHKNGSWSRFMTPKDLYIEIMIFDRGGKMQGGEYKLKAPTGSKRLGHHPKPTGKKSRTGKPATRPHLVENVREHAPRGHGHLAKLFE